MFARRFALSFALLPLACVDPPEPDDDERTGIGALGFGRHSIDDVEVHVVGTPADGLDGPRDLDFNPDVPGELWVVNRNDDSTVTFRDLGTPNQKSEHLIDPFAMHFMEEVSSISFATGMKFGTCQESRNTYNGGAAPNDFMGPSLWSADPAIYARTNPEAVADNGGFDLGSHLDMLHESPLCMGIAWEQANVYWTFDGLAGTISRYDFQEDHGPGFDDHSDGIIEIFVDAEVTRVPDVPSHLVFDPASGLLYAADTGNGRIVVLDRGAATFGPSSGGIEPGTVVREMEGGAFTTLVEPEAGELVSPSGIALHDRVLYVADNATSRITAFSLDGERLDWLETGLPEGALMGLRVDAQGSIFAVDFVGDRVLRFSGRE